MQYLHYAEIAYNFQIFISNYMNNFPNLFYVYIFKINYILFIVLRLVSKSTLLENRLNVVTATIT